MIDGRVFHILVDSFGKILLQGLMMTIPLTAISFTLALCIVVIIALVQIQEKGEIVTAMEGT